MLNDANRNTLLHLLLFKNNLSIDKVTEEIVPKNELEDYVRELNNIYKNELRIDISEDAYGVTLKILDENKLFINLNKESIHDFNDFHCRMAYILNELINSETYQNILDFSDYMNVSRSTVNNDLRKTKQLLKKYNAEIVGVPNKGIKFVGSEFSKRLVLIYEVIDYFPSNIQVNNKFIKLIESAAEYYRLDDSMKLLLYKVTLVSIYRMRNHNPLKAAIPMYKNFEKDSKELNDFIEEVEKIYEIKLTQEEIDFISFPINTRNSVHTYAIDNTEIETMLHKIVSEMIESIRVKFMIHVDEYNFFKNVKYHLLFLINRLIFKIPVKDIFSESIRIHFPLAFEMARTSMNVLHEKYNLVGTTSDINYLAVYFALILDERRTVSNNRHIRKVAVVTNRGKGTFELIRRQLEEVIGSESEIDFLTVPDLIKEDTSKYGILFTTEDIITNVYLPIVKINGIIDHGILNKKISEIEEKKLKHTEIINNSVKFQVMHLNGNKGYRDNVRIITDYLLQKENVSKDIYSNFEKRESVNSMIYENGIAFPHFTDNITDKLNLTLGILEPETDDLKIIFLLLIPENIDENQEDVLMEIYDKIFTIISDKRLSSRLQHVNSINDLYNFFSER